MKQEWKDLLSKKEREHNTQEEEFLEERQNEPPAIVISAQEQQEKLEDIQKHKVSQSTLIREVQKLKKSWCKRRHPSWYFENTVLIMIILSSLMLVIDNPLYDPESTLSTILKTIDTVFTILFTIEAVIKIIALGFFTSHGVTSGYITNGWNILDFVVVLTSLVDFVMGSIIGIDTGQLKSLKAL